MGLELRNSLKSLRQRRGLAASELARQVGVSRQTIYAIEAGDYVPNTAVALRLARALEARVEEVFDLTPEPSRERVVEAELLGAEVRPRQALRLVHVGRKRIAVAAEPNWFHLAPAHGLAAGRARGRLAVRLLPDAGLASARLLIAGCDPAVSLLAERLAGAARIELAAANASSRHALEWLRDGRVHIAGCHLRDRATDEFNLPAVREFFPKGGVQVIEFAHWENGLVLGRGNPKGIAGVEDLARRGVRFLNREAGAGSRTLLDQRLARAGIDGQQVAGYQRAAHGHLPAARQVSAGEADCTIATRAAAEAFGLDFIPLETQRYDLVIPRRFLELPAIGALLDQLSRASLRRSLEQVGGYDTRGTGTVRMSG
ncbi:MAG: helix-turn-helix domain-containing protein [Acidobacteria bacterium]|nr:helix-turn-helix domain-containing protein [Acidobacteriota bacterium]